MSLQSNKQLVSIVFSVVILAAGVLVLSPFLLAIVWAAIIATASWPLHQKIKEKCAGRRTLAASLSTMLVGLLLVGPMIAIVVFIVSDFVTLVTFLQKADQQGVAPPVWLEQIPLAGQHLQRWWFEYLSTPNQVSSIVRQTLSTKLAVLQDYGQVLLIDLTGRVATFFFALWVLYFFYLDGSRIVRLLNQVGYKWLEKRWPAYVYHMPDALRGAVNGLVIVSFAEAIILAALLWLCGVPSPVLLGLALAILAFVPMAAPVVLALIGALVIFSGSTLAGVMLIVVGMIIILGADYVVRPILIQGRTDLPFLMILFGIFGGIITMGVIGVIVGPVILVLLLVFFREAALDESRVDLDFHESG